jgi:hypothetical protein
VGVEVDAVVLVVGGAWDFREKGSEDEGKEGVQVDVDIDEEDAGQVALRKKRYVVQTMAQRSEADEIAWMEKGRMTGKQVRKMVGCKGWLWGWRG